MMSFELYSNPHPLSHSSFEIFTHSILFESPLKSLEPQLSFYSNFLLFYKELLVLTRKFN